MHCNLKKNLRLNLIIDVAQNHQNKFGDFVIFWLWVAFSEYMNFSRKDKLKFVRRSKLQNHTIYYYLKGRTVLQSHRF